MENILCAISQIMFHIHVSCLTVNPLIVFGAQSACMCEHTPSHMQFVSDA